MEESPFFEKIEKIKMIYRILILVGTIVLLGGLFVIFVVVPKAGDIKKTTKQVKNLDHKLTQAKLKARNLKKFEAERTEVDAQFRQALKLLPDKKEIPELLRNITQLGNDSRLEFRLFRPKKEKKKGFYLEVPVNLEVSGTYHNVATFFDKVGRMERIVNILDVSMKPSKAHSTRLITKCNAVTYRFKGKVDAKATDKKKKT